jgi:hypothetical protein
MNHLTHQDIVEGFVAWFERFRPIPIMTVLCRGLWWEISLALTVRWVGSQINLRAGFGRKKIENGQLLHDCYLFFGGLFAVFGGRLVWFALIIWLINLKPVPQKWREIWPYYYQISKFSSFHNLLYDSINIKQWRSVNDLQPCKEH